MIDLSHDNSGKDPARQPEVAGAVGLQIAGGNHSLVGVMVESFLVGGRQDPDHSPLTYGQSITDGCIGWDQTVEVLDGFAEAVSKRRAATR
jgi:3-deoxy-7-phosphoheptulonate synthase